MPIVRFLPSDTAVDVEAGTLIHEAATKAGIEDLQLPCGGKGTCGKCLVEVVEGAFDDVGHSHLVKALAIKHLVMACQTRVRDDIVIRIQPSQAGTMQVVGDSRLLVSEDILPAAGEMSPIYRSEHLSIPAATIDEHYSDWQRLVRQISRGDNALRVSAGLRVLRTLAAALREESGKVTVTLLEQDGELRVLAVEPGHAPTNALGIAIDIGTTTCAVQLVRLSDGHIVAGRTSYNAQISRGADIMSRIDYARTVERQAELRELVLGTLNELIEGVCAEAGVDAGEAHAAFIAGNTTMIHLLLALPPRHIRETPYVPTVTTMPRLTAAEVGLLIDPYAVVAFAPGVGSYVGGDITAGLLCTELVSNRDDVFLFLDIGTNGEIVLGNADWLATCACSAGPAFEGSGIKCGMRATVGAIEYITISPGGKDVDYDVIGNVAPAGICGSGLIGLLGELLLSGMVDQMGRFNMESGCNRLLQTDAGRAFVVAWAHESAGGEDLVVTEPDIENLIRTKAAIYAACSLLLEKIGLDWSVISKVYIAGGFGRYIQVDSAVRIGLLPDLAPSLFHYIGNAALTGAYVAMLSREKRELLASVAARMTYIDLSSEPHYMDSYLGAMFLPHTDMAQFPSVAAQLGGARPASAFIPE